MDQCAVVAKTGQPLDLGLRQVAGQCVDHGWWHPRVVVSLPECDGAGDLVERPICFWISEADHLIKVVVLVPQKRGFVALCENGLGLWRKHCLFRGGCACEERFEEQVWCDL